jgi:hypothetical protein
MTMKVWCIGIVLLMLSGRSFSQEQPQEKKPAEPPTLEIPEITIVGKKAITLPFARKGEIYDVNTFEAPLPDSSLLGKPPSMSLLLGSLPRYQQREMPWRISAEGGIGTFGTINLNGLIDYKMQSWNIVGDAGYATTNGHVANASSSSFKANAGIRSVVLTDNNVLKSFRASFGTGYEHNSYGLFGIPSPAVRRVDNTFIVNGGIGSLERQGNVLDIDLTTSFSSLTDSRPNVDSSVSVISPQMRASYSTDIRLLRLSTVLSYAGSSLNYKTPTQSPSLVDVSMTGGWQLANQWFLEVGGRLSNGSDSHGETRTLISPLAMLRMNIDTASSLKFWFQPQTQFTSYDEYLRKIPYLDRAFVLQPERQPVRFGSSLFYHQGTCSFEVRGSYAQYSNNAIAIADSGRIHLEYVESGNAALEIEATTHPTDMTALQLSGTLTSAHETGSSVQLPMVPAVNLRGRGEINFTFPFMLWSSVEYQSPRNIDRLGSQSLSSIVLVNAGASATVASRIVFSADLRNLFDVHYDWWNRYPAPGIQFNLSAKLRFQ